MGWSILRGNKTGVVVDDVVYTTKEKILALRKLIPIILLIGVVLGSIYKGVATPTEAAAFGVTGSLLLSLIFGSLSLSSFIESVSGAVKNSCMLGLILVGAHFLTLAMGFIGIPNALAEWIDSLGLSPIQLIVCLTFFFVILGCFLDGISVLSLIHI